MGEDGRDAKSTGDGYFSIDLQILWKIATEDLQPVIATLRGVVEQQD